MKLLLGLVGFSILIGVLAATFLPWWGVLLLIGGIIGAAAVLLPRLLKKLFEAPFRAKGAVLRGAKVSVHAITPAEPPAVDPNDEPLDPEMVARRWLYLDLSVAPMKSEGSFRLWEPGELLLVAPESSLEEGDDSCEVWDYQLAGEGGFVTDEMYKHEGEQRLRLHVAVKPTVNDLALRYYFEDLARVKLPSSSGAG